jgi:hypothetical protein
MTCKFCNKEAEANVSFCSHCGGAFGGQPQPQPQNPYPNHTQPGYPPQNPYPNYTQPGYPPPYQQPYGRPPGGGAYENPNDLPSVGWKVLGFFSGFFLGLITLVIYFVVKNEKPRCAAVFGKWAIIGVVCTVVLSVLFMALLFSGIFLSEDFMSEYSELYETGFTALRNLIPAV